MPQYFDNVPELASKKKTISFVIKDKEISFVSDIGVFSKDKVDEGTIAFLKMLLSRPLFGKILDLGSGYGALGLTLALFNPNCQFVLADVNERALALAKENQKRLHLENVTCCISDIYENITELFHSIVINPPIRAGKKVIYPMFKGAYEHLIDDGSLFIVIRKSHGAHSAEAYIKSVFGNCALLKKEKGYYIYEAKKGTTKKDERGAI